MSNAIYNGINTFLAVLGVAAVFGALNKMKVGTTRPCVILATALIGVGLAGQALGLIWREWMQFADTALYGGVLALLIASQRVHTWILERWANPLATVIAMGVGALLLVGLLGGCAAPAPLCEPIGYTVGSMDGVKVYAFTEEELIEIGERQYALQEGRCRMPERGT